MQAGETVSHFRILEKLGGGGMGVVYRAEDLELGRPVALKFLSPQWSSNPEARERFLLEARAASSLEHPNTCTIHQIGTLPDGQIFIVMALIRGETVKQRIDRGPLPQGEAVAIVTAACQGLGRAHELGIVHRDIKPSNVMITDLGVVKVLDFGIAKLLGETGLTKIGKVLGSVDYMSPEQASGKPVDRRSDVWSLGAMLYEMLSGRKPFQGESEAAVLYSILHNQPQALSELIPGLPANIETAVVRALAKKPDERLQSCREMIAELTGESVDLQGTRTTLRPVESRPLVSVAVLPFADMSADHDQDYFCDGIAEELIHVLSRVPGLRVASRTSAFQFRGWTGNLQALRDRLGVTSVLEGSVRREGNRVRITAQLVDAVTSYQVWSGRYDRELTDIFAIQEEIAEMIVETLQEELLGAAVPTAVRPPAPDFEAYNLYLRGRFQCNKRTETAMQKSLTCFREVIAKAPSYARGYAGLADASLLLGVYGLAAPGEVMPQARQAALRALEIDGGAAEVYTSLGCLRAVYDWAWPEAERDFQRAIQLDPGYATAHQWYAINLLAPMGRFAEAAAELRTARELDPLSLPTAASIGLLCWFRGDAQGAVEEHAKALEIDPQFAMAHFFRGQALVSLGREDEGVAALRQAVELSGGPPETQAALGHALAAAGRSREAHRILSTLRGLREKRYVSASLIAQVHAGFGEWDEVLSWLDRACGERAADLAWVGVRPPFAPLRGNPRFVALLDKMGLSRAPVRLTAGSSNVSPPTLV
jgi:eukaryotic-like serine/threonine-protein kinase